MTIRPLCALLCFLGLAACDSGEPTAPTERRGTPVVTTTLEPITYFARRIGGGLVEVDCPMPPDADPVHWTPARDAILRYQRSDLILLNGAGLESWAATTPLPESRVVDTSAAIGTITLESVTHSHGASGSHSHAETDPHTWLDPGNAIVQARAVRDALVRTLPEHEQDLRARAESLEQDLRALDTSLRDLSKTISEQRLLCAHPAYNYLARSYGWEVMNFDLDPALMPSDEQLAEVSAAIEADAPPARIMLWESEPTEATRAALESLGVRSVVFTPAETPDPEADYLERQRANVARLRAALE